MSILYSYQDVVRATQQGHALMSPQGKWLSVNPAFTTILGYTLTDLNSTHLTALVHQDDLETAVTVFRQIAGGDTKHFQGMGRFKHRSGKTVWVQLNVSPVYHDDATLRCFHLELQDVTIEHQHDEDIALAASVFGSTLDGIFITSRDGTILKSNPAFTRILGYGEEEVLGKNARILRSDRHNRDFFQHMWEELTTRDHWQGEIWNRHKDGNMVLLWLSISTLPGKTRQEDRYIAVVFDISAQKLSQERLSSLANFDMLTGLLNRTLFVDRLENALTRTKRHGGQLVVMFVDIDNFQKINETFGHQAGDEVLRLSSKLLKNTIRETDTVARWGADEFILMFERIQDLVGVRITAQKILNVLTRKIELQLGVVDITVSIGISIFPADSKDANAVTMHADLAVNRVKAAGGNGYQFFDRELN